MEIGQLEGIKYSARFEAEITEGRDTFTSCECADMEYEAPVYSHKGYGRIVRATGFSSGGEFLFGFETKSTRRKRELSQSVRDLVGGEYSYIDLGSIIGRETFLHCVYQHIKRASKGEITPQFLHCHSIPQLDVMNAHEQMSKTFSY